MLRLLPSYKSTRPASGFILVLVILSLLVLMGVGLYALSVTLREMRTSANQHAKTKALYTAEGAVNRTLNQLAKGYLDPHDAGFVAFDPLDPQGVFKRYVDEPMRTFRQQGRSGRGIGTVDYKVVIDKIDELSPEIAADEDNSQLPDVMLNNRARFGRNLQIKGEAETRRGARSSVRQHLILSYLPNVIFKYGMLTNRLKECQFCHMNVTGDVGQVGGEHFSSISPHVTMGIIDGNLYLSGDFRLNRHPAHKQQLEIRGQVVEHISDPDLLPRSWPSLLDRSDPKRPQIAGFYIDLADKAQLKGSSRLDGGEILLQERETDRFTRVEALRDVVNSHVILTGTRDNPLHLDGPVVIRGDVILSGYITGRGSIYVERNAYLIGDVLYVRRPDQKEWRNVFAAELKHQQGLFGESRFRFDKLGLFAGGNVVIGNLASDELFRYVQFFLNYESSGMLQDPQNRMAGTQRFEEQGIHDPLGVYAMDGGSGLRQATIRAFRYYDRYEDGSDYDRDGRKQWGEGMRWITRKQVDVTSTGLLPAGAMDGDFKGGWISRSEFNRRAVDGAKTDREKINRVTTIDGTIYTDGAFTGFKPSNDKGLSELGEYAQSHDLDSDGFTFNGAVIARDVDVLAPGGWYVQYDNRNYVGEGSTVNFEPSRIVEISGWREE